MFVHSEKPGTLEKVGSMNKLCLINRPDKKNGQNQDFEGSRLPDYQFPCVQKQFFIKTNQILTDLRIPIRFMTAFDA
jgi:hypothetical protein